MNAPVDAGGAAVRAGRSRITRRGLRLGSGLLLLSYIAAHLLNHALGLVSLPLAERGLALGVAVWHSLPGRCCCSARWPSTSRWPCRRSTSAAPCACRRWSACACCSAWAFR